MQSIPRSVDVVVIGGGPAGSTAANMLAYRGFDVVLLEQAQHPRTTIGESVLPHLWKYVDELGVRADIEDADFIVKAGGITIWNGQIRQLRLSDFGFDRPGLHVERDRFDHILLNGARRRGATVFERVKVRDVHLEEGSARGVSWEDLESGERGRIECRMIIDGSGQAAVIARKLRFRTFDPDLRFMCVWGYYEDSAYCSYGGVVRPFTDRKVSGRYPLTVVSGVGRWGWSWHIVQREVTSVGLVLGLEDAAAFKGRPGAIEERFGAKMREVPGVSKLLESARLVPGSVSAIRDFAYRPARLCGDGWYLAGDASAFVDPINSAGLMVALYTGFLSAWAVTESLRRPQKAEYYRSIYDRMVRCRMSLYRVSALPEGVNSFADEDYPLALSAAQLDGSNEQELLLAQAQMTHREMNLERLQEMDGRLQLGGGERFEGLQFLRDADGSPVPLS